jgi:hypothetical protein
MIHFKEVDPANFKYDYDILVKQGIMVPTFSFRDRSPGLGNGYVEYIN